MANLGPDKLDTGEGTLVLVLDTTATGANAIRIGAAAGEPGPAGWYIHLSGTAATFGSLKPKLRVKGTGLTNANLADALYWTTDSETAVNGGSTSMTAIAKVYYVPTDECDLFLEYTANTTAMTVCLRPGRI